MTISYSTNRLWVGYALFMCAVTTLFFAPVVHMGLAEHDVQTFRDNARISEEFTFFFSPDKEQLTGRPVAELTKWFASLALGNDPVSFHALVIALHLAAAFLLVVLLRQLNSGPIISAVSGLLFLVHVGHFYAVYHISALEYPLSLVCAFTGLICWLRSDRSASNFMLIGAYLFLGIGVLSHIAVIAALPFLACWSYQVGYDGKKVLGRLLPLSLVLALLTAFALNITSRSASTWKSLNYFDWGLWFFFDLFGQLFWMLSKLFTTSHLLLPFWHDRQNWELYLGGLASMALLVLIYKKVFLPALWGVWILAALLPFALVEEHSVFGWPEVLSRYLYIASAGSSVFISWAIVRLCEHWGGRALMMACTGTLLVASFMGMRKLDDYFLYRSGFYLWVNGDTKAGIERVRRAVERASDTLPLGSMYFRLANMVLADGGDVSTLVESARQVVPNDDRIRAIRQAVYSLESDVVRAQQAREEVQLRWRQSQEDGDASAGRFNGMMATIYRSIGHGYSVREEWMMAVAAYDLSATFAAHIQDVSPQAARYTKALNNAGIECAKEGKLDQAIDFFHRSHAIMPNITAHYNEGLVHEKQGNAKAAIDAYKKALFIEPQQVVVLTRLGVVLTLEGLQDQAITCFEQALAIQPDYASALKHLSALRSSE